MKKISWIASLILMYAGPVLAQKIYVAPAVERAVEVRSTYPNSGSHLLREDWKKIGPVLKEFSITHPQPESMRKTAAWNFSVGSTHTWWATDLSATSQFEYQVPSTCRAVGTHCYIFVEDTQWNSRVTQQAVDSVQAAFDLRTPANPAKGIYDTDTDNFGNPPNIDNDPKIVILILDIKDGYTGTGGYVAGYFYGINEYSDAEIQQALGSTRHSSAAEIYYVDCNPGDLSTPSGRMVAASTTAHEFQHMIHFNYDVSEDAFVNEGLSESAEKICGYGLRSPALYYANTNVNFTGWNDTDPLAEYSRAALFTWYIIEQFGVGIAKEIVQSGNPTANPFGTPKHGIEGYNDALSKFTTLNFTDVLRNFSIATALNDTTIDPKYGFKQVNINMYPVPRHLHLNPNVPSTPDTIEPYGTHYVSYTGGDSLSFTNSVSTFIDIRAIATGSAGKKVSTVPANATYIENNFGTGYDKVAFVLTNRFVARQSYTYTASGKGGSSSTTEIAYDDGNPEGFYQWTTGDSVGVQFDAMPGMVLDSIKVAFRRSGSLSYGIWKYSGNPGSSPFGQRYRTGTMVSTDSTPPYPYPIPYQNWVKTDVSRWDVDLNYPFVVGFAFGANPTAPGLMMSKEPYTVPHHSYSYTDGSNGRQWYVIVTNDAQDSAAKYLVRAYMHYGTIVIHPPPPDTIGANTIITFPKKTNASDYSATDYRMVGFPGGSNLDIGLQLTGVQNTDWQVYWDNGLNTADSLLKYNGGQEFLLYPGRAFWIISKNDVVINRNIVSAPLNSGNEVEIALHPGWNLITNPFAESIVWSNIQTANSITSPIYTFYNGSFPESVVFLPYVGYYFFNGSPNSTLSVLKVPYDALYAKIDQEPAVIGNGWRVNVELISGGVTDRSMQFGISEFAQPGLDILDVRKPRAVGMIPEVYFERRDWDVRYPVFSADIRRQVGDCEQWPMTVKSNPKEPVSLVFRGIASLPRTYEVYLIDRAQAKYTDLRRDSIYTFTAQLRQSEYSIVVGKKEAVLNSVNGILPTEFSLGQNFPNPFNPATSFSVRIPSNSFVTVTVFNVLGQPVRLLYSGTLEAGQHWFTWDGRNDSQGSLPSGVYYCRMDVPGIKSFAQKMVLLK